MSNMQLRGQSNSSPLRQTSFYLTLALIVGTLASLPWLNSEIAWSFDCRYTFSKLPETDRGLQDWLARQPGVSTAAVTRTSAHTIRVVYSRQGTTGTLIPPFAELNYILQTAQLTSSLDKDRLFRQPSMILKLLIGLQAGFALTGLYWYWRDRKAGVARRPWFLGASGPAVCWGLLFGAGLLVFGTAYEYGIRTLFGPEVNTVGPWSGLRHIDSSGQLALILVLGCAVAPICEELFFRGAVLGCYTAVDRPGAGLAASSVAFAAVHLDLVNFVGLCVYGLVLGWADRRAKSLIAPMTAHALNNGVAFWIILQSP